jgi:hypothetical protein
VYEFRLKFLSYLKKKKKKKKKKNKKKEEEEEEFYSVPMRFFRYE